MAVLNLDKTPLGIVLNITHPSHSLHSLSHNLKTTYPILGCHCSLHALIIAFLAHFGLGTILI